MEEQTLRPLVLEVEVVVVVVFLAAVVVVIVAVAVFHGVVGEKELLLLVVLEVMQLALRVNYINFVIPGLLASNPGDLKLG